MKKRSLISLILISFGVMTLLSINTANAKTHQLHPIETQTITIFKSISPLVVNVHNMQKARTAYNPEAKEYQVASASGFVWDDEGYIITNYHVVHGANRVKVTFQKGESYDVDIIASSPHRDIAILKLKTLTPIKKIKQSLNTFSVIPISQLDSLEVGQHAIAIGNPYGLDHTLTTGVISATNRSIPGFSGVSIQNMIQTDASINPGNSGGPLLNSQGQVIGMNTMIYSKSGTSSGIGFAVPIKSIERTINQVKKHGKIIRPGLGFVRLSDNLTRYMNIDGVVIKEVLPNSVAKKAGLQGSSIDDRGNLVIGDVITAVNGQQIYEFNDLYKALDHRNIGEEITLSITRDNAPVEIQIAVMDISVLSAGSQ